MDSLRQIPGVGVEISKKLNQIGIYKIEDLKGKDAFQLYQESSNIAGFEIDRCLLYVYRLAIYYAEHEVRDDKKLEWWYWKDKDE